MGIVSYLLQALTSTPTNVPPFVTDALYTLQYGHVVARFGIFFLHELDLSLEHVIPGIRKKDTHLVSFQAGYKPLLTLVGVFSNVIMCKQFGSQV